MTMDTNDVAAQQQMGAIAAQAALCGLSDNPGQFREDPMSRLFRQAWRERYGYSDGMPYLDVPF
jgi:hypothetical protein